MKPTSDRTDEIGKMIRMAGIEIPAPGMTERIMNRIEVATLKKPLDFKPVIDLKGWILIGASGIILLILSFILIVNYGNNSADGLIDSEHLLLRDLHFDKLIHLNLRVPKALLFGLTGLLVWIGLDFLLDTYRWKKHTLKGINQLEIQ